MNEDNEQAGTCDHGSWSLRGERLARVRALGCVAGETDKPKDYEPTLEYSFFRSTARLSVEEVIFRGGQSQLPIPLACRCSCGLTGTTAAEAKCARR